RMSRTALVIVAIPGWSLLAALMATADRVSGGRLLGPRWLARVAVWGVGLSAAFALAGAAIAYVDGVGRSVDLGTWLQTASLEIDVGFLLDPLSATMAVTVAGLSWLVALFSVNYLHNEPGFGRYFTVLPLFVGAMLLLVLVDNYLTLFVAWEVVGACSYLLIAFYRDRSSAGEAGTRAFVLNRVGDAGLLAGLFVLATQTGSLDYSEVLTSPLPTATATAVGFCLLVGATGKSAQVPLGGWLARAMEGPTPSSALIHGATMVTAGVYLVVRSAPVFDRAPVALVAVGVVGALTALYGQLAGLTQTDIKGMLAASTNAHLGFMLLLCGLGLYPVAIFHLVAHAFYKTNLFLTAPSILHHLHGGPDPQAVARPTDTARGPAAFVALVAFVLAALPFVSGALPLPEGWARATIALGALGVVAAFGLWLSAQRMVGATFHDDAKRARRIAIAVAAGFTLVAVALAIRLVPGGVPGSWFAELLAPTVAPTRAPVEAPLAATALLVAALICLALSGILTPRFFDRFRSEQPAGSSSPLARRLYFAASNRAWLDEGADRATAAVTRVGAAIDRFDRVALDPLTGALLPAHGPPPATWEERLETALRADGEGVAAELDWLPPGRPRGLKSHAGAPPRGGSVLQRIASATARVERRVTSQSGGLYGAAANAASAFSNRTERVVFQRGIESALERVSAVLAEVTERVEGRVFQRGIESALGRVSAVLAEVTERVEARVFQLGPGRVAAFGERVRKGLLAIEAFAGRPLAAAVVALTFLIAVALTR
ncbi:MAG: hypothetical protein LC799_18315, partial [Actinobacteria bacterium]|nr:hypothetical protein [Actinomycetota bacterium]